MSYNLFKRKYTEEQVAEMVELYRNGDSIRTIAAKLNASYGGVHHNLTERQVALRKKGGMRKAARGNAAE